MAWRPARRCAPPSPLLIRGLYYEGWNPSGKPVKERQKEEFLGHIVAALRESPDLDPEDIAWGVFRILKKHVSVGEIGDVKQVLPAEIRALWSGSEDRHGS